MKLVKEYTKDVIAHDPLTIVREMREFSREKREFFVVFCLDSRQKLLSREIIHIGTLNETVVHPREIFKNAILRSAAAIIVSHNHPSGHTEPSDEDKEITEILNRSGEILGIQLVDHVIVGRDNWESVQFGGERNGTDKK